MIKGKKTTEEPVKQLTLRISNDLHLKLKIKCVKEGRTMGEALTELIKKYVDES